MYAYTDVYFCIFSFTFSSCKQGKQGRVKNVSLSFVTLGVKVGWKYSTNQFKGLNCRKAVSIPAAAFFVAPSWHVIKSYFV